LGDREERLRANKKSNSGGVSSYRDCRRQHCLPVQLPCPCQSSRDL